MNKSSEQSVIQAKLQLVEAEKQKAEAEKLKLDADFEYQSKLIRLRHEDSERKRYETERDARIAQELEARKREEAEQFIDLKCNIKMSCNDLQLLLKCSGNSVVLIMIMQNIM